MVTPLLDRPNVIDLLDEGTIIKDEVMEILEDFYGKYCTSEIVIQEDLDKLGIIIDAYNGEDNLDSETIWYQDF